MSALYGFPCNFQLRAFFCQPVQGKPVPSPLLKTKRTAVTTLSCTSGPCVSAQRTNDSLHITVGGTWSLNGAVPEEELARARKMAQDEGIRRLVLDTRDLGSWDGLLLGFVTDIEKPARRRKIEIEENLPEALKKLLRLAFAVESREGSEKANNQEGFLAWLGGSALAIPKQMHNFLVFLGDIAFSVGRLARGKAAMRRQDFVDALFECSLRSFGIVAITNLLFGLILAFVGAVQLSNFGAQIYVAGLVGIGMLRVMGAVMVGIVMSGRIGASYAALIGTMQVNEEVDALETMGISPTDFLVLPRMLALVIMVPMLTVFADLMGMVGGFLVGITILDLSPMQYIQSTISMVQFRHGIAGLVYATVYGIVIAVFGCYHGIQCKRSAQGVGQATTTAVVHSLVGIIVTTAIITVIFNAIQF